MCLDLNENGSVADGASDSEGDNAGVFTPIEATGELCPFPLPEGNNYCIGYYEAEVTNEGYVFVYNSRLQHLVYVIDGYTSRCQIVKQGSCLGFKLLPEHYISLGRCVLQTVMYFNKATNQEELRKYLIFTDNTPPIKFLSVTDSIATNGFTGPFFQNDKCPDCDLLSLGISTPDSCIAITPIQRLPGDNRDNLLADKMIQFRVKFTDVWNRETEHGIISDPWYSTVSSCLKEMLSRPRCLDLTFDSGCATIAKIQIEFRIWHANDPNMAIPTDWYLHDTIDKYDQINPDLQWWERAINPALRYDPLTNKITYTYCGDKGTTALPVDETNRNYNPVPITAATVFSANKSIGTANHRRGFLPLDITLLNQIGYNTEPPTGSVASCRQVPRTITVYGAIKCVNTNRLQRLRSQSAKTVWGEDHSNKIFDYKQFLPLGQEGFIGYFAGTTDYVISTQCRFDMQTKEVVEVGLEDFFQGLVVPPDGYQKEVFLRRYLCVQRWKFVNVTPGKKIFRMCNQIATPLMDYQRTSFPILGTCPDPSLYTWRYQDKKELIIDQCEGDVNLTGEILYLCDLTNEDRTLRKLMNICMGYLLEDEVSKIPIEKAFIDAPGHTMHPVSTDHNGFYFASSEKKSWNVNLFSTQRCNPRALVARSQTTYDSPQSRFRDEVLHVYTGANEYPRSDRVYIKGRVNLCDTTNGVSGVLVMYTGGGTATSDDSGNFTIVAHERADYFRRFDAVMFAHLGICTVGRCDNPCSTCFDNFISLLPLCTGQDRVLNVPTLFVKVSEASARGPQNGGRYELGIVPYYNIGQPGGVQRVPAHALDIPTIGETGVFGFSKISYSIDPDITFPLDVRYFTFVVSKNLNYDDFLTWVVDKVMLVDNTGNQNTVTPTQIKLYYGGLNEYNLQNGMATNAVWQFLDEQESPIVGDKIEIIANGDGTVFTKRISALVKFDQEGAFILVNYTDDLKGLKDGAQIKLIRPRTNINSHFFFELCRVIRVTNGRIDPADATGYLNYYDAYMLPRQVPIPFYDLEGKKDPTKSVLKTFPFPFEHHSPSDFWGDHAASRGRVHVVNPFESPQLRGTEVSLSKALAADGILNGLSYFSEEDSTEFDEQEWGSITCVIPNIGTLTVICQQDNFEVPLDDTTVRVGKDNALTAVPASFGRLGRPQRKKGNTFGCHLEDINTIRVLNGLIMFVDRSQSALVQLYGDDGTDVSVYGFKGHLKDKIKHMLQYNQSGAQYIKYFHGCFDPKRKMYLLTTFKVPRKPDDIFGQNPLEDYVNQLRHKSIEANETLGYNPFEKALKLSYSPTPEYWGTLAGHAEDDQLVSFKGGAAFKHHSKAGYLRFYGVLCEAVYEPVMNVEPGTVKRFLWTEVMCREQLFFCDQVLTEAGQRSRLLTTWWDKRENFFTADFKMNLLTYPDRNIAALQDPNKIILEGDPLSGKWIKPRYIARPEGEGKYFEMDGVHIFIFAAEKSGIGK